MEETFSVQVHLTDRKSEDTPPDRVLEEFVRAQLSGLLDIVVFTSRGQPVQVDGFLWMRDAYHRPTEVIAVPIPLSKESIQE